MDSVSALRRSGSAAPKARCSSPCLRSASGRRCRSVGAAVGRCRSRAGWTEAMIHSDDPGPQEWNGVHVTHKTTVTEIVDIDNVGPDGKLLSGFEMFQQAGNDLDRVIQQARDAGQRALAIGSGWGLSKINITDGK